MNEQTKKKLEAFEAGLSGTSAADIDGSLAEVERKARRLMYELLQPELMAQKGKAELGIFTAYYIFETYLVDNFRGRRHILLFVLFDNDYEVIHTREVELDELALMFLGIKTPA